MAGVYIDGELKAFTVGSLNERENMAVIHIEKADPEINGLYQFINQQFLVHEFPDVALVNREDDVGMPGPVSYTHLKITRVHIKSDC